MASCESDERNTILQFEDMQEQDEIMLRQYKSVTAKALTSSRNIKFGELKFKNPSLYVFELTHAVCTCTVSKFLHVHVFLALSHKSFSQETLHKS